MNTDDYHRKYKQTKGRTKGWRRNNAVWKKLNDRECFRDKDNPKALKIGIHLDIYQILPDYSTKRIDRFIQWWVRRKEYNAVRKLAEAGMVPRYDLWGNECPSGPVKEDVA